MGPASPARLKLLGYNEYQWAHIESLGYKLDVFSDFVAAIVDVKENEIEVLFNPDCEKIYCKMMDVSHAYCINDISDENVTALDAAHNKAVSQYSGNDEILSAVRRAESAAQSAFMMSCINL